MHILTRYGNELIKHIRKRFFFLKKEETSDGFSCSRRVIIELISHRWACKIDQSYREKNEIKCFSREKIRGSRFKRAYILYNIILYYMNKTF